MTGMGIEADHRSAKTRRLRREMGTRTDPDDNIAFHPDGGTPDLGDTARVRMNLPLLYTRGAVQAIDVARLISEDDGRVTDQSARSDRGRDFRAPDQMAPAGECIENTTGISKIDGVVHHGGSGVDIARGPIRPF